MAALAYDETERMGLIAALLAAAVSWYDPRIPLALLRRVDPAVADAVERPVPLPARSEQ